MTATNLYTRYQRQILLKEFGIKGQQQLQKSRVLVVGAGGLGCPALQYLAAAGIGTIGIADDDLISLSNLHRQILFTTNDVGEHKAIVAAERLRQMNPDINVIAVVKRLTNKNALKIIASYHIIIDGTDNFATRYMLNDACVLLKKPLVYGSVYKFEGQVAVFNVNGSANYRDIFPRPPKINEVPDCNEAGVIGVLPGIIGGLQASETIKLITGLGVPLVNRLLNFNALHNQFFETLIKPLADTKELIPADAVSFMAKDYGIFCDTKFHTIEEIDKRRFNTLMEEKDIIVIDVREENERPLITFFNYIQIPLSRLAAEADRFNGKDIITICQTGKRSLEAAVLLSVNNNVYSLQGGITNWFQQNNAEVFK
jgi:sulfur-carrier protein adenylyltransferase/sulfurtransferase